MKTYTEFDHLYAPSDFFISLFIFICGLGIFYGVSCTQETTRPIINEEVKKRYGFVEKSHLFETHKVKPNQFLGDILSNYYVTGQTIHDLASKAKEVYSVRMIQANKDLTFVSKDSCSLPFCFIYEPNPFSYIIYNFRDSVSVDRYYKEFEVCTEIASGSVKSSLWNSMIENGLSPALIDKMEDALASSVDFYHTKVGDQFKLIFERKYIDGKPISIGKIHAAFYKNSNGEHYSFYFENDKYAGFYDSEGRATKKAFLRSPVKYSRISSRFNRNRFHPILKRRKAHLGTDYAAAYGTPIRAVADGVISTASYTKNNGKYVKVKHDKKYASQYLHMSKFAKGIRSGIKVKQGQTIGFVGSTGLATGPHVCFRFWKNGEQIDHLRENFPPAEPMEAEDLPEFEILKNKLTFEIDQISFANSKKGKDFVQTKAQS